MVLNHPQFYQDIVENCHQYELTLMLLTSRPLKLESVRSVVEDKIRGSMLRLSNGPLLPDDEAALHKFIHLLDGKIIPRYKE